MIVYMLKCNCGYEFEAWFGKSTDFDQQAEQGLIMCPDCGKTRIEKAPMAPSVKRSDKAAGNLEFEKYCAIIRDEIATHSENVGDDFAKEARAMHEGKTPERSIYGHANADETGELIRDGIEVVPLPEAFVPRKSKKLN